MTSGDPMIEKGLVLVHQCLSDLYDNAEPSADWEQVVEDQEFEGYTISPQLFNSIVSTYREELPAHLQDALSVVLVRYSPEVIKDKDDD